MDGNHSMPAIVSFVIHCEHAEVPLIINIILGLPANMCVMWIILAGSGEMATEIFSLNQAICEVSFCVANVIAVIALNAPRSDVIKYLWYTIKFTWGLVYSGRPLFLSCVCFERYLAVVHPVTFLKYKLSRCRLAGALISWLTVLVCCAILLLVPLQAYNSVSYAMALTWFPVKIFFCAQSLRALMRPGPGEGNQASTRMNNAKRKAFRIVLIILTSSVVNYIPSILFITLDLLSVQPSELYCVAFFTNLVTGFLPPFLFVLRGGMLSKCTQETA